MNNLGYSNKNVFIGDVRVKGQDETVIIGNENGGPGYILPEQKGTIGQVITMNADNSTSFQDAPIPPGITGRIVKNLFVMRERTSFYNTLPTSAQALFQTGYGSNDVLIGDFPENSTIHIYSRGVISFDASVVSSGTGVFQLEIDDGAGSVVYFTSNNLTLQKQGTANENRFYQVDFIFQRTGTNTYRVDGYGLVSDSSNGQIKMGFVQTSYTPVAPYTQFNIKAAYYKIVSTPGEEYVPLAQVYINDLILDTSLLISPPPAPTSHTTLNDLIAGDAGHTQFALLQGRSGGQLLSGGINASHFLTLKAHRFGLNNIIIKDLETTFEKNIDMNQNQINDVSLITNTTAPLGLVGSSGTSAVVIDPDPSNSFNVLGQSDIKLNSNTDVILQSNTGFVDLNSNITRVNVGGITKFQVDASETTSSNNINMGDNEIQNLGKITSSADLTLTPANNVVCSTDLDMSNNSLLNGFGLNTQFLLASSQIETSQIVSVGLGQQSYVANPHRFTADGTPATQQLEINNVELSAFKPLNMNNEPINNVSSINGFTPSGGLFMGTSDGFIITATTAETTLLPATSVGTLTIPANGFKISSFHLVLAGSFASNNGDDLTVRLRSNATVLGDVIVPLNNSTASNFEIEVDFQIRAIGGAGVADILTNFDFTYNQSAGGGAFVGERNVAQNNTTFDTTISNTLAVSAQFSSASANNSIQTRVANLSQTY